jgi:hypothetical protein
MAPDQIVMVLECLGKRKRPKAKHQMERIGVKICDIMCPTFLAVSYRFHIRLTLQCMGTM